MVAGLAEEQPEGRGRGAEVGRGPEGEIDLERVREQKDSGA